MDRLKDLLEKCLPHVKPNSVLKLHNKNGCVLHFRGGPDAIHVGLRTPSSDRFITMHFERSSSNLLDSILNDSVLKLDPNESGWVIALRATLAI